MRPLLILAVLILWNQMRPKKKMVTTRMDFVQKLRPIALAIEKETGIKADLGVTQAAHESAWGQSGLTQKANNLFGFTGDSWKRADKPVIELPTSEFVDGKWIKIKRPFRKYGSWEESYRDWARLISTRSRYAKAYAFAKQGKLQEFGIALQEGGYATDPRYASKLVALALKNPELATI